MAKLISVLGEEIRRLARKEIRLQTARTAAAATRHRRDIAALKREVRDLRRALAKATDAVARKASNDEMASGTAPEGIRFSARSVAAQRRRLGLSAADFGKLVGVSGLTIYHWESKKSHPRASQLKKYFDVRGISKKVALERLGHRA